jgi:hypothetical protein
MSYTFFVEGKNCTVKLEWDDEGDLRIFHKPKEESEVVVPKEKKGFFPFQRSKNIKAKDFEDLGKQLEKEEKKVIKTKNHDYW